MQNGLVFLLLCATIAFIITMAMNHRPLRGVAMMQEKRDRAPVIPSINSPLAPPIEGFTVGYEKRDAVQTPLTHMPQTQVASHGQLPNMPPSANETVGVSCTRGACVYTDPTPAPPAAPSPAPSAPPAPVENEPFAPNTNASIQELFPAHPCANRPDAAECRMPRLGPLPTPEGPVFAGPAHVDGQQRAPVPSFGGPANARPPVQAHMQQEQMQQRHQQAQMQQAQMQQAQMQQAQMQQAQIQQAQMQQAQMQQAQMQQAQLQQAQLQRQQQAPMRQAPRARIAEDMGMSLIPRGVKLPSRRGMSTVNPFLGIDE